MANPLTNKTALHMACEGGHTDVLVALLNRLPALLMIDDSPGETSLHIAAQKGYFEIVRNLLMVAEQTEVLKSPDCMVREGGGFLYDHSNNRHAMNEALPEIEIDVMAKSTSENRTPLHDAAISGNAEVVKLLVNFLKSCNDNSKLGKPFGGKVSGHLKGSSPTPPTKGYLRNKTSPTQQSNLDGPVYSNSFSSKRVEPVPGIDLSTLKGRTAFHEAAKNGHFEVMEILLQAGADINTFMSMDLDPTVNSDLTALVQACLMDQPETVRFLLRHGAKDTRLKALSRSLKASHYDVAGILLCYSNQVKEVSSDIKKALSLSSEITTTYLQVSWNSKNLKFVRKEWLERVICELPQFQGHLCAIAQLDLSSNQITELPIEIFKLSSLANLDISRNELKSLPYEEDKPDGGWTCSKLSTLEAVHNQITFLPPSLFHLKELKEVNACSNKISSVPASVWKCQKLTKLYLARNVLEMFPTPKRMITDSLDDPMWDISVSPSHLSSLPATPDNSLVSDSGYRSDSHSMSHQIGSQSVELNINSSSQGSGEGGKKPSMFKLPYGPVNALSNLQTINRKAYTIQTHAVISRRLESFHDANTEEEELDDLDEEELEEEEGSAFLLEVLDLSSNKLSAVPANLCCLAPKLTKLNLSKNLIKSLGNINDFPPNLEFLDASSNDLHSAIAPALGVADQRYQPKPCVRKQLFSGSPSRSVGFESSMMSISPSTPTYHKLCSHRTHKNLRKLSTLKLNNNHLMDLQLFRSVRNARGNPDLSSSYEEMSKPRSSTTTDPYAVVVSPPAKADPLTKSVNVNFVSRAAALTSSKRNLTETASVPIHDGKSSGSSPSEGSQDGSDSRGEGVASPATSVVITPLYPTLATLELSNNLLHNVPSNVHLITSLSSLTLNHNKDIDTLPLQLSNCEHLWNLEYEGCPLTNPPKEDLDKFRLASDKLLYMRSLLHE